MFLKNKNGDTINTSKIVAGSIVRVPSVGVSVIELYVGPHDTMIFDFYNEAQLNKALHFLEEVLTVEHIRWIRVGNYQFRADKILTSERRGKSVCIKTDVGEFYIEADTVDHARAMQEQFNKSLCDNWFMKDLYNIEESEV